MALADAYQPDSSAPPGPWGPPRRLAGVPMPGGATVNTDDPAYAALAAALARQQRPVGGADPSMTPLRSPYTGALAQQGAGPGAAVGGEPGAQPAPPPPPRPPASAPVQWPVPRRVGNPAVIPPPPKFMPSSFQPPAPAAPTPGLPAGANGNIDVAAFMKSLPPVQGLSPVGQASLNDTMGLAQQAGAVAGLVTPPTPFEERLRHGGPAIAVMRGPQTTYAIPEALDPGVGGAVPEFARPISADDLAFGRLQDARQRAQGVLLGALQQAPELYKTQGQMADAQIRAQLEFGPMKAARDIANGVFVQTLKDTGDYEKSQRASQQAYDNFMLMNRNGMPPGPWQPAAGGQPPTMPGQAAPGGREPPMPAGGPVGGFAEEAGKKFLADAKLADANGKATGDLDAQKLAETLQANPELLRRGGPVLARTMLDMGLPPVQVVRPLEEAMIRYANEAYFGGKGNLQASGSPGRPRLGPVKIGQYTIEPSYGKEVSSGNERQNGWVIRGPGLEGGTWYSGSQHLISPYFDTTPTFREATLRAYKERAEALATLRAAIAAEQARRTGR